MKDIEFIILLPGISPMGPINLGDFVRTSEYDAHVYKGRSFPLEEFNRIVPEVLNDARSQSFAVQPMPRILPPKPKADQGKLGPEDETDSKPPKKKPGRKPKPKADQDEPSADQR